VIGNRIIGRRGSAGLLAILALAAILRIWGLHFGLPHTLTRPDEDASVAIAMRFFSRSGNPGFFDWPSLFMYAVTAGLIVYFQIGRLVGWFPYEYTFLVAVSQHPAPVFLIARWLSAAAGTFTVATMHAIGVRLFDRTTALVGALFLACAALHVRDLHFGVTDVAATWLVTLSFLYTVKYAQAGRRRDAVVSALYAGLAASTKYNAALILLPASLAIVCSTHEAPRWRVSLLLGCVVLAVAAFFAGTPYALIDRASFFASLASVSAHLRAGHAAMAGPGWIIHLSYSLRYGLGLPLLIAGIAGLVLYVGHDWRYGLLFSAFPVAYYALIGSGQTAFARYIIPVVPFLCLAAGHLLVESTRTIARWSRRPQWATMLAWISAAAVAAPSTIAAVRTDWLLTRTDNRLIAAEWIHQHYPGGATIAQTGSIAGHVYMITADPDTAPRYRAVTFDEGSGTFRAGGAESPPPDVIVLQECPLPYYCDVSDGIRRVLRDGYELQRAFIAVDPSSRTLVYDRDDAFYLPLTGFSAVVRPGPNLSVYRRRPTVPK